MCTLTDLEHLYTKRVLPDFRRLAHQARAAFATPAPGAQPFQFWESPVHGVGHYARVGCLALVLHEHRRMGQVPAGRHSEGAPSPETVEALVLSAFFHDSGRVNEYRDPDHGRAGERIFRRFAASVSPALRPAVRNVVSAAILYHCGGGAGVPDAVATAIANADRLDRIRFGDPPDPDQMCPDEGAWRRLAPIARDFVHLVSAGRVLQEVGSNPAH